MNRTAVVLFDAQGPNSRRRTFVGSIAGSLLVVVLAGLVIRQFAAHGQLSAEKWEIFSHLQVARLIGQGLVQTVKAAAIAGAIALVIGIALAIFRVASRRLVTVIIAGTVEIARSLPTLLILYFTLLMLPQYNIRIPTLWQLVIALTVTNAALISEIIRASILSIPRGQADAGLAIGLTERQALLTIVLPQAFRAAMPSLVAQLVFLLKGTTLGFVISYEELLYEAQAIGNYTSYILQAFIVVGLVYAAINIFLSRVAFRLEKGRQRRIDPEAQLRLEQLTQ